MTELDTFCGNFCYLREISGLSVEEMAKCIGISVYSVKIIEQGRVPGMVKGDTLMEIYENFGITPSEMLTDDREMILNKYLHNR